MQILIYPGTSDCGNWGDLAMLQVATERLKALWPDASLQVLTEDADALKAYCPGVTAVPWRGAKRWLRVGVLPHWLFPDIRPEVRHHFPITPHRLWQMGRWLHLPDYRLARAFAEALFNADLLVLSGCGIITDAFSFSALRLLDMFEAAAQCRIPTAMLSQGLGPIQDEQLLQRVAAVLPRVGALFVRERGASLKLLERMKIPQAKICVTGDDAVELAFRERRGAPGTRLGVNLRVASYAAVDERILETVHAVLSSSAAQHQTRLVGIPISHGGKTSDVQTLRRLLHGVPADGDAGAGLGTPVEVIRRVADCRVVVAGSYHAGVFALSQGIPVVGIVQSAYYREKFQGLAGQFGVGCVVLQANEDQFASLLRAAVDEHWRQADVLRPKLLEAAERQMADARAAYARLPALILQNPAETPRGE